LKHQGEKGREVILHFGIYRQLPNILNYVDLGTLSPGKDNSNGRRGIPSYGLSVHYFMTQSPDMP
jgi:hypothetical protein